MSVPLFFSSIVQCIPLYFDFISAAASRQLLELRELLTPLQIIDKPSKSTPASSPHDSPSLYLENSDSEIKISLTSLLPSTWAVQFMPEYLSLNIIIFSLHSVTSRLVFSV
ncbi:MAG: hypothetical protein A2504_05390 [Bdellovibrionales bacterium RIFOXYD12_FULL_39_22]|nr:MAG: hypothetical protein A2385_06435 [Bdellovibrionales bacterium RIFOXYB1_FULL_39_21]OFZ41915.1 MAG: hypothetical protein A2485_08405 [Bdellovibrionales bacterium RIFOXYC12_FULL_39_17]OFZ50631.1 MAG: hypothetical protein A2404_05355 [Bdellovibrionales bacterium RIFOXYC1_FULL_39_130]OFZ77854.1 MAG: hypothetical protein A2560_00525 [Bdellovibrionales bacterium RIFOXYD1_FULL_39_84]OFZ93710.1 MAG: hypothetical protein A2504_05390 [Bdellovibrionales bacterium RIFOXYD12_FULL_39_22]